MWSLEGFTLSCEATRHPPPPPQPRGGEHQAAVQAGGQAHSLQSRARRDLSEEPDQDRRPKNPDTWASPCPDLTNMNTSQLKAPLQSTVFNDVFIASFLSVNESQRSAVWRGAPV